MFCSAFVGEFCRTSSPARAARSRKKRAVANGPFCWTCGHLERNGRRSLPRTKLCTHALESADISFIFFILAMVRMSRSRVAFACHCQHVVHGFPIYCSTSIILMKSCAWSGDSWSLMRDHSSSPRKQSLPRGTVPFCLRVHAGTLRAAADAPGPVAQGPGSGAGDALRFAFWAEDGSG